MAFPQAFSRAFPNSFAGAGSSAPTMYLYQNLLQSAGELIEGFESAAEWVPSGTATITNDAVNFTQGTQSVNLAAAGANANGTKTVLLDLNGKQAFMRIDVYSSVASRIITTYLSANIGFTKYFSSTLTVNRIGWNRFQIIATDWAAAGGAVWTDPVVRLRVRCDTAGDNFSWDNFLSNVVPQGAIILMFDDAFAETYTNVFPYMAGKHMVGTACAISSLIDTAGYMTSAQLQSMYAAGWDISNHSSDITNFTTLTQAQIETRLSTCKIFLDGLGLTRASSHVVYPSGGYDSDVEAAMLAQAMLSGRLAFVAANFRTITMPLPYQRQIPAYEIINTTTLATIQGWIDQAVNRKGITCIFTHKVAAVGGNMTIANFQAMIDYIVTSGLPVLTISQLWALQSGPLTVTLPY